MANIALISGNLGQDPELRYTAGGSPVCNFSIASKETFASKDGVKETTDWTKVVVWGSMAEWCGKNLTKGSKASVIGKIKTRSWEKDGKKNYATELIADLILEMGEKTKVEKEEQAQVPISNLPF